MSPPTRGVPADAWRRVRGREQFTADVRAAEALHAAFTLSPFPRGRILSIDVSRAEATPGVVAVITGADIGEHLLGRSLRDYPVLATGEVRFIGQRVAAVAAADPAAARLGADLVDVEYEPLGPLLDAEAALDPHAPELHPQYSSYQGARREPPGHNVQGTEHLLVGDPDAALAACEEVYEHTFRWPRSHSAPLEPHTCLVAASEDRVAVWSAHKEPYRLRRDLAELAGLPEDRVTVHPVAIGGDFGAKGMPFIEGACLFLSRATGRPVRSTMTYAEELTSTTARHPGWMTLTTGMKDGRIHGHRAVTLLDGGAYVGPKPRPTHVQPVIGVPLAPYQPPHREERSTGVYTSTLPGGQVRSPGEFQATFAGESHIDLIARARGIDPMQFRLEQVTSPAARRVLQRLRATTAAWRDVVDRAAAAPAEGIGVAAFHRGTGAGETTVSCTARPDGVELLVGVPDQGAGSYSVFRRLAAESLGVAVEWVTVHPRGADPELADRGAGASRVTRVAGLACVDACRNLLAELGVTAPPQGAPGWLADHLRREGLDQVRSVGHHVVSRDQASTQPAAHGALALHVAVDAETGVTRVRRAHLVVDAGPVLNPVGHRGQLEGAFAFGLSQAMFEDLQVEDGQVVTASLGDYKLASAADVPPLEIEVLEPEEDEGDILEALRGVGELANLGVAPALANAIDDAVGVRVRDLPITAERVWRALQVQS